MQKKDEQWIADCLNVSEERRAEMQKGLLNVFPALLHDVSEKGDDDAKEEEEV